MNKVIQHIWNEIRAVNQHGGFGKWSWAVSFDANDLDDILQNSVERETAK